jgi:hypothetical protein
LGKWDAGRKAQYAIENISALALIYLEVVVSPTSVER